jgi:hypothetical protein
MAATTVVVATMQVAQVSSLGADREIPEPGPGQVLGLNIGTLRIVTMVLRGI